MADPTGVVRTTLAPYRAVLGSRMRSVYSRGASVAVDSEEDPELNEQHWSYMDGFADGMTARGPTLGTDRQTWTGSLHVVDLSGPKAMREFVAREPYNKQAVRGARAGAG